MARGYTNFNPGNIRRSDVVYKGERESSDYSFKQFTSMAYGFRALFVLLRTYEVIYHLNTLQSMLNRYAPPTENDTTSYVAFVSGRTRIADISTIDTLNAKQMIPIATAIARMENGSEPDADDVQAGWELFRADY
jgi:hypothetical protein